MRRGEMLPLRFADIDWTRRMITLRGATTKSRRIRLVPIERVDVADVAQLISPETAPARDECHTLPGSAGRLPQMPLAERHT